jgi:hypothetical protein
MDYPTHKNRLLYYELYDMSQTPEKLLRTVTYTYWETGEASDPSDRLRASITIKDEDPTGGNDPAYDWYHDLALYYEGGRQTMRMALWDRWQTDGNGEPIPETYEMAHAREFRYEWAVGGPRERYLTVDGNPNTPNADPNHPETYGLIEPVRLTDYLGDTPYADADVTNDGGWSVAGSLRYLFPGAQETVGTGETQYYHGDLIGSTMLTTDDTGAPSLPGVGDGFVAYTAFGEILDADGSPGGDPPQGFPRYQYAGAWGYETAGFDDDPGGPAGRSHLLALYGVNPNLPPITLQHVGFRWYDPALGRFVQRDAIGLAGGLKVYLYVDGVPTIGVDPNGSQCHS